MFIYNIPFSLNLLFSGVDLSSLRMKLSDFKLYLNDKRYNNIYNESMLHEQLIEDYPLNKYFLYSSHNTYLTKDQLFGKLL